MLKSEISFLFRIFPDTLLKWSSLRKAEDNSPFLWNAMHNDFIQLDKQRLNLMITQILALINCFDSMSSCWVLGYI